jgi:cystathionine beta-lyase
MNDYGYYEVLRETQSVFGQQASPDDCFLVLRGLRTLNVRFAAQGATTINIARQLELHPLVQKVLLPALPSAAGHDIWKRDFSGTGCLFSVILTPAPDEAYNAFFDALRVFSIGASSGGVDSLAAFYPASLQAERSFAFTDQPVIRLSIGLEDVDELMADLHNGLLAFEKLLNRTRASKLGDCKTPAED